MAYSIICETCGQAMGNPACPSCRRQGGSQPLGRAEPAKAPDRRDPAQPGRRATDPTLTTRECADRLGVTTAFIIGEIRDGRLSATVLERDGHRTIYRVAAADLEAYERRYRWARRHSAS